MQLAGNLLGRNCVEVCPEAGAIVQKLAARITADGGSALISDYGHLGECGDTLRVCQWIKSSNIAFLLSNGSLFPNTFRRSKTTSFTIRSKTPAKRISLRTSILHFSDDLLKPQKNQVSLNWWFLAYVLPYLWNTFILSLVIFHGPVSQAYFLVHMGILLRLKVSVTVQLAPWSFLWSWPIFYSIYLSLVCFLCLSSHQINPPPFIMKLLSDLSDVSSHLYFRINFQFKVWECDPCVNAFSAM